jgi:hypothetical protein
MQTTMTRRDAMVTMGATLLLATGATFHATAEPIVGRDAARQEARRLGYDPDEVVSYGPPSARGDADPVEQEAPIWMLLDESLRSRFI